MQSNTYESKTWACHVTKKRLNLCDGSSVHVDTILKDPKRMNFDELSKFLIVRCLNGRQERTALLQYATRHAVNLEKDIVMYVMPVRQCIRFCDAPTYHEEEWLVIDVDDRLFAVAQLSDIFA